MCFTLLSHYKTGGKSAVKVASDYKDEIWHLGLKHNIVFIYIVLYSYLKPLRLYVCKCFNVEML